MTIGAVNSYQYASLTQYQYFGTTVSTERLKYLMQQYGIKATGDTQKDIEALYQAMYSVASGEVTSSAKNTQNYEVAGNIAANGSIVPWANIMGQVGLTATGELTADYATFNNKINAMWSSVTSQDQQATISLLQAEASTVFIQQNQSVIGSSQGQKTQVSGVDIMAQLNKLYLFGG